MAGLISIRIAFAVALGAASLAFGMGDSRADVAPAAPAEAAADWGAWTRPLAPGAAPAAGAAEPVPAPDPEAGIDVVDAHWMALTMFGEARGGGETAMRAVGHVIDNRRRAAMHGRFATDQVGEAYQFSCWNAGDPNRALLLNIDALDPAGRDFAMWQAARRIAAEILAGASDDPTGGALFYHTQAVAPSWSRGVAPVTRIGTHLFFLSARQAG